MRDSGARQYALDDAAHPDYRKARAGQRDDLAEGHAIDHALFGVSAPFVPRCRVAEEVEVDLPVRVEAGRAERRMQGPGGEPSIEPRHLVADGQERSPFAHEDER